MPDLRTIRTFSELKAYLEEELDWPMEDMDIEDLTFEYDPEGDLGLDPKTAAKIRSIKQLRQLDGVQPFGIFFVEFDRKRLPVVAMRRILGKLVTKKRESANPTEHKTWNQDDLLFVSAYGDDDTRRLDFAHFADDAVNGLPTLRVLGWDADDTDRKLDWVEKQLREKLIWPDEDDPESWRKQWREAFVLRHREVIDTSKKLAHALAVLAQKIRKRAMDAIELESPKGHLRKLHKAFQDSLIHDLDHGGFADMYAQTIAYGLLSVAISRTVPGEGTAFVAEDVAFMVPRTNPFLQELMQEFTRVSGRRRNADGTGIDFDELGIREVADLLREAKMEAVIADFGRERPGEDPVVHFYEYFMEVYDKQQKVSRGVFYTPKPVVSFIVRSVDEILREEFELPLGLADTTTWDQMAAKHKDLKIPEGVDREAPFVQILDPATGTGTFLVEVIDLIYRRMHQHWLGEGYSEPQLDELWNGYVADHLLPRLNGFELMMAPYAIAHMKIGLKLADTGYRFKSPQRLRVFLTNSLEPPTDLSEMLEFVAPFLAHEARAGSIVKQRLVPTAVVGNPPYSLLSSNLGEYQRNMVSPYKTVDGHPIVERSALQLEKNLNDDYVKFIRLAETTIPDNVGVVGLITNHSFLDNPTLRGLRWHLLKRYQTLLILDCHGNATKREVTPSGAGDSNLFAIRQGVSIHVGLCCSGKRRQVVRHGDLWGTQGEKERALSGSVIADLAATPLQPSSPLFLFVPVDSVCAPEFALGASLSEIMPTHGAGYITARDNLVVGFVYSEVASRITAFASSDLPDGELLTRFEIADKKGWSVAKSRKALRSMTLDDKIILTNYRPFDARWVFYDSSLVWGCSWPTMRHLVGHPENLCILATRMTKDKWDVFVARVPSSHKAMSAYDTNSVFPLFLYESGLTGAETRTTNLRHDMLRLQRAEPPLEVLAWFYGQLWSREYRRRYADHLRREFPRLFRPRTCTLRTALVQMGSDLIALHLLEGDYPSASWNQPGAAKTNPLVTPITTFRNSGDREVRKVGETGKTMAPSPDYGPGFGRVYINDIAHFDGVPEAVWNFHIGGYQVCHKWLYDRRRVGGKNPRPGRVLTDDDIAHYQKIVIALNETIRIMGEIDEVIEEHGGWPGAFVTDSREAS